MELPPFPTVGAIPTLIEEVPPPAIESIEENIQHIRNIKEVPSLPTDIGAIPKFSLCKNST